MENITECRLKRNPPPPIPLLDKSPTRLGLTHRIIIIFVKFHELFKQLIVSISFLVRCNKYADKLSLK